MLRSVPRLAWFTALACFYQSAVLAVEPPAPAPTQDVNALGKSLLDRLIQQLDGPPGRAVSCIQEFRASGTPLRMETRFLAGSGKQARLEITIRQAGRWARRVSICDGTTVQRIEASPLSTRRSAYTLEELNATVEKLGLGDTGAITKDDLQADVIAMHGFAGISGPLRDMQRRIRWESLVDDKRGEVLVKVLEGAWTKETVEPFAPAKPENAPANSRDLAYEWRANASDEFVHLPRRVRLVVRAEDAWPMEAIWLGPIVRHGNNEPIMTATWTPLPTATADTFVLSTEEQKHALETLDLHQLLAGRQQRLLQLRQMEQQAAAAKPLDSAPPDKDKP